MAKKTPEAWWAGLGEDDRAAYIAASSTGDLTQDLWQKLVDSGVMAAAAAWEGQSWSFYMPNEYLEYVQSQAPTT